MHPIWSRALALATEAAPVGHRFRRDRRRAGWLLLAGRLLPHAHRHDELGREIEGEGEDDCKKGFRKRERVT